MDIIRRNKTFTLRKRVPRRYSDVEPRAFVWISLHTDSEAVARTKAPTAWAHMIDAWEARLAGDTDDAERRFEAARNLAQVRGFRYLTADRVAALPTPALLDRVDAVMRNGEPDRREAAAILGGVKEPPITVTRALDLFWIEAKADTIGKSEDQLRRWRNPRIKAIGNFVHLVGDKPLVDITRDDLLAFRGWWTDRLESGDVTANSANKDLIHLAHTLRFVVKRKQLGIALPLGDLAFKEGERPRRPPFSDEWIKTRFLAPGALDGLDTEARCIVLAMINTGFRPSEGAGLLPEHIRLDADVPHISIQPVGRQLKNAHSKRVIPLVGVSLDAFRECPNGFPTYFGRDKISDTVGNYLDAHGLRESPQHVLYSLRHSFEDRMLAAGFDYAIRCDLFGHKVDRERYGDGAKLEHKRKLLQAIAL